MTALRNAMSDEDLAEQAERGEPEMGRWSQLEQLVAGLADAVRRLEYVTILVNSDSKSRRPDPPEPIRRPGAKPRKARPRLSEAHAEQLFGLINGGAA
jgi:hypothetical protein